MNDDKKKLIFKWIRIIGFIVLVAYLIFMASLNEPTQALLNKCRKIYKECVITVVPVSKLTEFDKLMRAE